MKRSHLILTFILSTLFSCTEGSKSNKGKTVAIESLERTALDSYNSNPIESVETFKKLVVEYRGLGRSDKSAIANLNIAGIYDEKLNDYPKALSFAKASLNDWKELNDSMQIANLYKYVGLLESYNDNFDVAIDDIQKAIRLYEDLNFEEGVAVSHINMAKVLHQKGDNTSALQHYKDSKGFWRTSGNNERVFDNNLVGIEIYTSMNLLTERSNLIKENDAILKSQQINEFLLDKFLELKAGS